MGFDGIHKPGQETEIEVMNAIISRLLQVIDGADVDLENAGEVTIGNGVTALAGSRVDLRASMGGFYPPAIANASLPPAAASEGMLFYDTTNNKLVFSNGTAWETVTSS